LKSLLIASLFLQVSNYPPETGPLSVYTVQEYFDTIDYAIYGYANLSRAIGPYSYPTENNTMGEIDICFYQYREGTVFGFNESYIFNPEIDKTCITVTSMNQIVNGSQAFFHSKDIYIMFSALVKTTVS